MENIIDYFTLDRIISFGAILNIIITERGAGKSFQAKKYVTDRFLKKKEKFIYLRRYENELKNVFEKSDLKEEKNEFNFFNSIKHLYPGINLMAKNRKFYFNEECFGRAKRITEYQDLKSSDLEDVTTIIIDEYFIEPGRRHYLPNEGMILMNIFDSVLRNRTSKNIKIFVLGNSVENLELTPIFTFFDLTLPYKKDVKLFKNNLIAVQYTQNTKFSDQRKDTIIGKLASGTPYEQYAIQNQILNKNNDFIMKKNKNAQFRFSFIYHNKIFGVWISFKDGLIFISNDVANNRYQYALTLEDHRLNTLLIKGSKNYSHWRMLLDNFKLGNVYYESAKIKQETREVFKLYI